MASTPTFPYEGWVLTPLCNPQKLLFKEVYWVNWHTSFGGKSYRCTDIYVSEEEAIKAGFALIEKKLAALQKQEAKIKKQAATLTKAAAKLNQKETNVGNE